MTDGTEGIDNVDARLRRVEAALAEMRTEVRTERVRVVDRTGRDRIVGEVTGDTAELRVLVPGTAPGYSTRVALFATPAGSPDTIGDPKPFLGLGIMVNGQLDSGIYSTM